MKFGSFRTAPRQLCCILRCFRISACKINQVSALTVYVCLVVFMFYFEKILIMVGMRSGGRIGVDVQND